MTDAEPPRPDYQPTESGEPPRYGQAPYLPPAPPVSPELAGSPQRPERVGQSINWWFSAAGFWYVVTLVSAITHLTPFQFVYTSSQSVQTGPGTYAVQTQTHVATVPLWAIIVTSTVSAGLWAGLILLVRGGANWARIVLTIIAVVAEVLTLLDILGSLANPGMILAGVLNLVVFVQVIVALVKMYGTQSNDYFRSRR